MATTKKTAQQYFLEAYHYHLLEQSVDKAIKAYKKCIQLDPGYTDAYVNLGLIHLKRKQYEKALQYFARVVQLEPENIEAYINLGYAYEKMERFGSAKQMYELSLKINPRHMEAFVNLANIAEMQADYNGAIDLWKKAIEVDPNAAQPHFFLAATYDRHDMFDEAIEEYRNTLGIDPNHLKALFNLGRLHLQQGEPRKAFDAFARVVELSRDNTAAWNYLGYIYETLGSVDYAIYAYSNSLIANNYQEDAHYNLARLQYIQYRSNPDASMLETIKSRLQYVLSANPKHREAKQLLGMIQLHRAREQKDNNQQPNHNDQIRKQ